MKKGFTLAEVLITLGIIGIVAAMTIPTLMANINGARYKSQFKKTLSSLNQAVRMNQAKYDWNFADMDNAIHCMVNNTNTTTKDMCNLLSNNMSNVRLHNQDTEGTMSSNLVNQIDMPNAYVINTYNSSKFSDLYPWDMDTFDLADGSIFSFNNGPAGCTLKGGTKITTNILMPDSAEEWDQLLSESNAIMGCFGFIDVNGKTGPNKEVQCSNGVTTEINPSEPCVVNKNEITDIFPVVFHDSTVEPLTNASAYVLNLAK